MKNKKDKKQKAQAQKGKSSKNQELKGQEAKLLLQKATEQKQTEQELLEQFFAPQDPPAEKAHDSALHFEEYFAEEHSEGEHSADEKHKHRSEEDRKRLINRLKRIEGQIRGIQTMVEDERYCIDILTQCAAVQAALNAFNKELLSEHIETCVLHDVRSGNSEEAKQSVSELVSAIQKLMK